MRTFLTALFLTTSLFADSFTYLLHSQGGELTFNKTTKVGTLTLSHPSDLVPLFSPGNAMRGYTHLSTFLRAWQAPVYAMVAYYGLDENKNVYHAIPLQLESLQENEALVFEVKVLNDLQVTEHTFMGETLLYIDNFAGDQPGCVFPGAGWGTPGCHNPIYQK